MSNTIFNLSNVQNTLVNSPTEGIKMLPLDIVVKKDTKLCYCEATIFIKQYVNNPEVVLICMTNGHTNHVPGNTSEIRTLPLPSEAIKIIEDQLKGGSTCRNTRISVLKQIEEWGVGIRKPNYEDIYNRMRKVYEEYTVKFHPDENKSLDIWMHEKLPSQNYCIFTGGLSAYSNNAQHFVFGFQSPSQMMLMRISRSFCLDATYNISACNIEILYSLVTRHPDTGKGSPVAYMITNDHSVSPINQWLVHLRKKSCFTPLYITIDCRIAEVNAITAALPQAIIHFCEFHVLQQLGKYKYELKANLKNILIESDENEFLRKIQKFRLCVQSQQQFLTYFEHKWIGTEELLRRWGRPYVANDHQRYLTNNYIKSRLDYLVFILTNDVEFFYNEEVERIHIQNGRMGLIKNELAQHSFSANTIQDDMLPFMIINSLNEIGNSMEDSNGKWTVKSFTDEAQWENNYLQLQRLLASEHEVAAVNEKVENETNTVVVSGRNNSVWLQRFMTQNTTLHHQREDLEQLMDVPGIDEAEL
ncbi:hypothetical protein PHYBLDRAFT_151106 [Phycomyces blakesleeanus NRRL 1555(-)]|uniref:Uncharacterized protein n=1 Tax=Phycomyces blakesleeanus (strain ATCC 8743b / DSM 1359 / FGSC 10004 / NBRC 33097 / NRRL 1555) TaxID=763407 RepID=A0A167KAA1_PHYB8|nr:hypothetical protein PHYBLDRAFT_151106 [Phycomyces blakesleeanus NRRL 1555(-)]OAD67595.1 hypothetical protein PHYBLDRAFT_151106 [Phycomyces blakesleeanus NRRL 1555(-)]|eukprot:XP_018285635.1 hypothetical protein PHYBLDRAFT_151106 [Phycomyces blakesleeanus NRRL 1555(-)]